jgi:hypothetical protein
MVFLFGAVEKALAQTPTTQPYISVPATAPAPRPAPYPYRSRYVVYEPGSESLFADNRFDLSLGAQGYSTRGAGREDTIVFITGAFRYTFATNLSIGFELGIAPGTAGDRRHDRRDHHHDDNRDGVRAVEELADLRWHFITTEHLSFFIDGGLGGLQASHDFPSGARSDHWLAVAGGGMTFRLDDHWYLQAGARYARLGDWDEHHHHGNRRGSDGVQYYGGFAFVF